MKKHRVRFETVYDASQNMDVLFTRDEAPGAIPNGTFVVKCNTNLAEKDKHPDGAPAHVLGSIGPIDYMGLKNVYGYFVEWLDKPNTPCFIVGTRIRKG